MVAVTGRADESRPSGTSPVTAGRNEAVRSLGHVFNKDIKSTQHGEPVLALDSAAADAPRQRSEEDPWIEIVGLHKGTNRSTAMELRVTQGRPDRYSIVLKYASGRQVGTVSGRNVHVNYSGGFPPSGFMSRPFIDVHQDGIISVELPDVGDRVEAWVEYEPGDTNPIPDFGRSRGTGIKISKSATMGAVGQLTFARVWTDTEKQQAENERLEKAPPPSPPPGHIVISDSTQPLVPGMPILIAEAGQWKPSELLAAGSPKLVVKTFQTLQARTTVQLPRAAQYDRSRCAVAEDTLKLAAASPGGFKPTINVFPNGTVIPAEFEVVTADMKLVPGVLLSVAGSGDSTYVGEAADGKLKIRDQSASGVLKVTDRSLAAIRKKDAARLADPQFTVESKQRYASLLRLLDRQTELREETEAVQRSLRTFGTNAALLKTDAPPTGFRALLPDEFVPAKAPLLMRNNSRWSVVTCTDDSPEGRIDVRIEDPYIQTDQRVSRQQLYVKAKEDAAERRQLVADLDPKAYSLTVEASTMSYELRQILTKDLGVDDSPSIGSPPGPFKIELKTSKTPLEARKVEYRLFAAGATVTMRLVTEIPDGSK
jgi:hypothetical protein